MLKIYKYTRKWLFFQTLTQHTIDAVKSGDEKMEVSIDNRKVIFLDETLSNPNLIRVKFLDTGLVEEFIGVTYAELLNQTRINDICNHRLIMTYNVIIGVNSWIPK